MTTVPENLGGGGTGPNLPRARRAGAAARHWNRLWQVPLLLGGLAAFGYGVRAVVKIVKPVPFENQASDIRTLLSRGKYPQAIDAINRIGSYYKEPLQQGTLQELAGDAEYLAQAAQPAFVRKNYEHVESHYKKAVALGIKPDARMNERWGQAELALGNSEPAIDHLEAAITQDPSRFQAHVRDLVAAYMVAGHPAKARTILDRMLAQKTVAPVDDRAWALCKKIEMAMASGASGEIRRAIDDARAALPSMPERDPAGRVLLWIGRAEYEQGQLAQARRDLTDARSRFIVHHLDDGRAAILLGKIAQARDDLDTAEKLYQDVCTRDTGTTLWPAARFGRAEILALRGDTGDQMQADYRFVIASLARSAQPDSIGDSPNASSHHAPELVTLDQVRASLITQYQHAVDADKLDTALLYLALYREIGDPETAAMAYRLASTKERRAAELLAERAGLPAADTKAREEKKAAACRMLAAAAEDYLRHSRLTTMTDDVSGNSLWHAAQLFDMAGETDRSIATYEKFTHERPKDPRTPEGLLATGRLYQSIGKVDKAIAAYQRDRTENPRTPAAYTATVNLARCYMDQGAGPGANPENFTRAEQALLSLVQDNEDLLPTAKEFRESLFTLGELYYTHGRWADAILRLEECIARYPGDPHIPRAMFMLAESYRKSAAEIAATLKATPGIDHRDALEAARIDRLHRAAKWFTRVIAALDSDPDNSNPDSSLSALNEQYLRSSYFDRADTYFALGDYPSAIKLYDQTAARFPQNRCAIEAYVQIVSAYLALGQPRQADAAAERAQWILQRIPDEAFATGPLDITRQYYANFFKLGRLRQQASATGGTGG